MESNKVMLNVGLKMKTSHPKQASKQHCCNAMRKTNQQICFMDYGEKWTKHNQKPPP